MNISRKIEINLTDQPTVQELITALERIKDEAGADSEIELPDYYTFSVSWEEEI